MSCLFFRVPLGRHRPTWFLIYSGEFISLSILLYFDRCPRACCWYYQFKWCRVCTNESLALFRGSAARGATSGTLVIHGARSQSRRSVESEQPFRRLASFRSKISELKLKFCVCVCVQVHSVAQLLVGEQCPDRPPLYFIVCVCCGWVDVVRISCTGVVAAAPNRKGLRCVDREECLRKITVPGKSHHRYSWLFLAGSSGVCTHTFYHDLPPAAGQSCQTKRLLLYRTLFSTCKHVYFHI